MSSNSSPRSLGIGSAPIMGSVIGAGPTRPRTESKDLECDDTDSEAEQPKSDSESSNQAASPRNSSLIHEEFGVYEIPEDAISVYQDYYAITSTEVEGNCSLDDTNPEDLNEDRDVGPGETEDAEGQDLDINKEITTFIDKGCGCPMNCTATFTNEVIMQNCLDCKELDMQCDMGTNHLKLLMLGALNVLTEETHRYNKGPIKSHRTKAESTRLWTNFMFRGQKVCKKFFLFIFSIGRRKFEALHNHLIKDGIVPPSHGNTKRLPAHALSYEVNQDAFNFINAFALQHALVLPGRTPANHDFSVQLLPCSMTKKHVYEEYKEASVQINKKPMSLRSWYRLWTDLLPNIVIQRPRTDLCPLCQSNILSVSNMAALDVEEKERRIALLSNHLQLVKKERLNYSNLNKTLMEEIQKKQINVSLSTSNPCSYKGTMHYSFDFAQQVHLPQSSQQVGPLYFLTGYKVALFGISCEPLGKFVLYMIPEACAVGKGSNTVISLLHHFFEKFSVGEEHVVCHADNCSGQNKNNYLMQYASWRVMTGRHQSMKISFLPVGHTKFAPDLYFGFFKKRFGKSEINTLEDLRKCANEATSISQAIIPCLVGKENGETYVTTYDWKTFFNQAKGKAISQLKQYFHFAATKENLGTISASHSFDTEKTVFKIFENNSFPSFPNKIPVPGLTDERKKYLYEKIRPYTADYGKDILCPKPATEEPESGVCLEIPIVPDCLPSTSAVLSSQLPPSENNDETTTNTRPAVSRKKYQSPKCGYCHQSGHTNRVSKGKYQCPKRREDEAKEDALDKSVH